MSIETYVVYLLAIFVLTASPGPSVLLCVSTSISKGIRASMFAALGSLTAILGIMTLSFTGLGMIVASSETAFNIIKWIGAAYLFYLGVKTFLSEPLGNESKINQTDLQLKSKASLWLRGFLVGATNPKALVFFTALFPQFINQSQALFPQYILLVSTFTVLELLWLFSYAHLGSKSAQWIFSKARAKLFNRLTGSTYICAGLLVSATQKSGE